MSVLAEWVATLRTAKYHTLKNECTHQNKGPEREAMVKQKHFALRLREKLLMEDMGDIAPIILLKNRIDRLFHNPLCLPSEKRTLLTASFFKEAERKPESSSRRAIIRAGALVLSPRALRTCHSTLTTRVETTTAVVTSPVFSL